MSAVSSSVMPASIAASTTALVPARSTRLPKLLQPSPAADTISPESPSDLYRTGLPHLPPDAHHGRNDVTPAGRPARRTVHWPGRRGRARPRPVLTPARPPGPAG